MKLTSPALWRMLARSDAASAVITRLGSPGAPGWMIGGCAWAETATATSVTAAVRVVRNRDLACVGMLWD